MVVLHNLMVFYIIRKSIPISFSTNIGRNIGIRRQIPWLEFARLVFSTKT